ncbi:translation initiation factor IF-3 [Candidatus Roizmanbacteria bacterium]|nr:translation initiation factor IF-3 [Candidatus Roizmanbacteria bacterium]
MRKRFYRPQQPQFWTNERIRSRELRVIGSDGELIGVLSRDEALSRARQAELDLVEVAPNAQPPVAKIVDYNKFLYEQSKKKRESKKGTKSGDVKEIWLTPLMADHDLSTRAERGKELLIESGKLKVTVRFRRQQLRHKEFGFDTLNQFVEKMGNAVLEKKPQFLGNRLVATVSRK